MSLLFSGNIGPEIHVELWKPEENTDTLLSLLGNRPVYTTLIKDFSNEKRKIEKLTVNLLLKRIFGYDINIKYSGTGRPYLENETCEISISHTRHCIAVAMHTKEKIGVDVETIQPRIKNIQSRVLNTDEIHSIQPENELIHSTLLWSAKEAIFKASDVTDVDFKDNICLSFFIPETKGIFDAEIKHPKLYKRFKIFYTIYPEFVFTLCYPL
ncbi:4'-phosphopantetheinyl transferase family protein [Coprobacter tertius]|uniref:4'-phosphopantetheinyl transferase superfamily protein n=1 Tax=Coprobacter tertius TaxID=2944915 RepID=A0ABT1MJT6_9BACT|nr:4'-phosphopantetheinyl transferase family protein [Coprobacter tertius]MCP9612890.1 4'-phosphopantetheinyl transferase superfamily protein [Coprobacter tertius]